MPVTVREKSLGSEREGYLPVALDTLCAGPVLEFDLYIPAENAEGVVLYRERNYPLEHEDLQGLAQRGVEILYIPADYQAAYRRYLFDEVVKNSSAPPAQRYKVLTTVTRSAFTAAFQSISPDHMVQFAEEFGKHMADIICTGELSVCQLTSLMQHDYYTYTHSVNVCTCSVSLANMLWNDPRADLQGIARGAVLHDLGKRRIPRFILNKRGMLCDSDRETLQQHPRLGFEELCMREDVAWGTLMTIYQHHERIDGRGYPARLTGQETHEWARLCAVADVFDALRSNRPYRKASRLQDVVQYLDSRAGREFDREMVQCWSSAIKCKN
jgi:HD-GYP domain-containing protein (c-di-GMP phosphodiesterase class II)